MSLLHEALLQEKIAQVAKANIFTNAAVPFDEIQAFVIWSVFTKPSVQPEAPISRSIPALKMEEIFFSPCPPHVLVNFVVFPPGHGRNVTDF